VKRSFRTQIARYHPDKVQHLGREFQSMAADRAAELTEAYRILSDPGRRAEYDQALAAAGSGITPSWRGTSDRAASASHRTACRGAAAAPAVTVTARSGDRFAGRTVQGGACDRDEFVRKATLSRLRQALTTVGAEYEASTLHGFDLALVPKSKLFGRSKNPRLLARFVSGLVSRGDRRRLDPGLQVGRPQER